MRGRLAKRENFDDKPGAVDKRIDIFQSKTIPVLETYKYKASLASRVCTTNHILVTQTVEVDAKQPMYELTDVVLEALTGELRHGGRSIL